MNRRLRKKLQVKEFQVFGLKVVVRPVGGAPSDDALDLFIEELEDQNIMVGGGFGETIDAFFTRCSGECKRRGRCHDVSLTELDGARIANMMHRHFGHFEVDKWILVDAWYEKPYQKRRH
jgi:uncharacterized protein YggL (DUF469 family)